MKTTILILLIIFSCISCDVSKSFIIDGEKEFVLSTECGTMTIRGSSSIIFGSPLTLVRFKAKGKYHVSIDSLKLGAKQKEIIIENVKFRLINENKEIDSGKEIDMNDNESLVVEFDLKTKVPNQIPFGTILILPSNFITCNDKPIITDTIHMQLTQKGRDPILQCKKTRH